MRVIMQVTETLILYLILGGAVGAALWTVRAEAALAASPAKLLTWILFWPFFASSLLSQSVAHEAASQRPGGSSFGGGSRLSEAQRGLRQALQTLGCLTQGTLQPHLAQIDAMVE